MTPSQQSARKWEFHSFNHIHTHSFEKLDFGNEVYYSKTSMNIIPGLSIFLLKRENLSFFLVLVNPS